MTEDLSPAGVNTVSREVVAKIAAAAAREVTGVAALGGDVSRFFDRVLDKIGLDELGDATRGVHAQVKGATAQVTVVVVIDAGKVVADVAKAVQVRVTEALQAYGLTVTGVNVKVDDIEMPKQATPAL
jgi:uncharacterized alkaline shock family protein YloU